MTFFLDLSGTYIKEFVHGDCGRTQPSLGSLLSASLGEDVLTIECDLLQLDVLQLAPETPSPWPREEGGNRLAEDSEQT